MSDTDMDDVSHYLPALRATPNKLPTTAHDDAPVPPPLKALCPDPDLTLLVGGELGPVHQFKVSRSALCLASTVFRAMLRGKFSEANKNEIELEEDDPDALLIVLRIAHWKLNEVRRSLDKAQLVNVATICDKYDMVTICRPFVPGWVQGWLGSRSSGDFEESLWVAWVFGYENDFDRIANSLLLNITTDSMGDIMHENVRLCEKTMPPDIVDQLQKGRLSAIQLILNAFNTYLDYYATRESTCKVACNQSEHKSCQAFLAGQLLLASYQLGNFPTRAQASDIFVSVATFYLQLGGVNLKSYVEDSPSRQRHDRCNRGGKMLKELASVYADLPSVVLDSHCVHMKEQWKKGNPDPEFS